MIPQIMAINKKKMIPTHRYIIARKLYSSTFRKVDFVGKMFVIKLMAYCLFSSLTIRIRANKLNTITTKNRSKAANIRAASYFGIDIISP